MASGYIWFPRQGETNLETEDEVSEREDTVKFKSKSLKEFEELKTFVKAYLSERKLEE